MYEKKALNTEPRRRRLTTATAAAARASAATTAGWGRGVAGDDGDGDGDDGRGRRRQRRRGRTNSVGAARGRRRCGARTASGWRADNVWAAGGGEAADGVDLGSLAASLATGDVFVKFS